MSRSKRSMFNLRFISNFVNMVKWLYVSIEQIKNINERSNTFIVVCMLKKRIYQF